MKQSLRQLPSQVLKLTPNLQNQIKLLSLPSTIIRNELKKLIKEFCEEDEKSKEFRLFEDILLTDK